MVSVIRKAVRWPSAPIIQALSNWLAVMVARKAVAIHCASSWPIPKPPITWGTATLTSVALIIMAAAPLKPTTATNQR